MVGWSSIETSAVLKSAGSAARQARLQRHVETRQDQCRGQRHRAPEDAPDLLGPARIDSSWSPGGQRPR